MTFHPLGQFRSSVGRQGQVERRLVEAILRSFFKKGSLRIHFGDGSIATMGDGTLPAVNLSAPRLRSLIMILLRPGMNTGRTYMNGDWYEVDGKLADFIQICLTQESPPWMWAGSRIMRLRTPLYLVHRLVSRWRRLHCRKHYNIDKTVFEALLGPTMTYSCAFFESDHDSLDQAQRDKIEITISRLAIGESDRAILDIGCGWGTLSRELAARNPQAQVLGITVSTEQYAYCRAKAAEFGNLDYKCVGYDELAACQKGAFDRIVSVGMLEHAGIGMLPHYFRTVREMLRPGGLALVHSIVTEKRTQPNAWVEKNIFPGGYIPCFDEVMRGIQESGLSIKGAHIYQGSHYAKTIEHWRRNFYAAIQEGKLNGYDPEFIRMMDFYLAGSETTFYHNVSNDKVAQFVIERV